MTTAYQAEEADQQRLEEARVAEWAREHANPLTAALERVEALEAALRHTTTQRDVLVDRLQRYRNALRVRPDMKHPASEIADDLGLHIHWALHRAPTALPRDGGDRP